MGRRVAGSLLMVGIAAAAAVAVVVLASLVLTGHLSGSDAATLSGLGLALLALGYVAVLVRRLHGRLATLQASHKRAAEAGRKQVAAVAATSKQVAAVAATSKQVAATSEDVRSLLAQDRSEVAVALEEVLRRTGGTAEVRARLLDGNDFTQLEALVDLRSLVSPRRSMPPTRGWALAPTSLLALVDAVLDRRPELVVECGSGVSSVWVGYALEQCGRGRCVSLEHDAGYAEQTREHLRRHGLDHLVQVRHAPLVTVTTAGGETFQWYDPTAVEDLAGIGVVLVDGPPGATGALARYPALAQLSGRCTDEALFLLDDASRPDETAIVERWLAEGSVRTVARSDAEKGWHLVALVAS